MLQATAPDARVNMLDMPVAKIKVQVLARRLREIELALGRLPLHALVTIEGTDVSGTIVDAVLDIERVRDALQTAAGLAGLAGTISA